MDEERPNMYYPIGGLAVQGFFTALWIINGNVGWGLFSLAGVYLWIYVLVKYLEDDWNWKADHE